MNGLLTGLEIALIGAVIGFGLAMLLAAVRPHATFALFRNDRLGYLLMFVGVALVAGGLYLRGYEFTGVLLGIGGFLIVWGGLVALDDEVWTPRVLDIRNLGYLFALTGLGIFVFKVVVPQWPAAVAAYRAYMANAPQSVTYWFVVGLAFLIVGVVIMRGRTRAPRPTL
jgi:hypothetical protein